jgi:hypothetical protein
MSVKSKVKRCNAEIKHLKEQLETSELLNHKLQQQFETLIDNKTLENIVKFAVTQQIGGLHGGITINAMSIDKMNDLRLFIDRSYENEDAYIIRVTY